MQTSRVIAKAPMRISLFGGGTDLGTFAGLYGGKVINFAIDKYSEVTINPIFKVKTKSYKGGGLGGSASMMVASMGAMYKYLGIPYLKQQLADLAYNKELEFGRTGCQDHYASVLGGFNYLQITDRVVREKLPALQIEKFLPWLVMFKLDMKRNSYEIQKGFEELKPIQIEALKEMVEIVPRALYAFEDENYPRLGKLLDDTWLLKKLSNNVSNDEIDKIYASGIKFGALGGKVLGAGGGGHILFVVEPKDREEFIKNMELKEVPFKVDYEGLCVKL